MSTTTLTGEAVSYYNRGPVTAVYTPPTSCLSTFTSNTDMYFGHRWLGYIDPACYPSSTTDLAASTAWDVYYYSPAQCPLGWAHAQTLTGSFGRDQTMLSVGPDTTVVVCCPSGFVYSGADGHDCLSTIVSTITTLLYISPTLNANNLWTATNPTSPSTLTVTAQSSPYNIYGDGIPVWWQSSDLKAFSAASLSTSSSSTTITSATSMAVTTASPTTSASTISPTPAPTQDGLSTGAKIAIGVAIPLAVISAGLLLFWYCLRKRQRQRIPQSYPMNTYMNDIPKEPDQTGELSGQVATPELYAYNAYYDPHQPPRAELH